MKERKEYICLGQDACFNGEIYASHVIIEGSVTGTVCAKDIVHLKKTARVKADIYTARFVAEEGSVLHGELHLDEFQEKDLQAVERKLDEKRNGQMTAYERSPENVAHKELADETIQR